MVQSRHRRRPQKCLYAVRPCSSPKPTPSASVSQLPATSKQRRRRPNHHKKRHASEKARKSRNSQIGIFSFAIKSLNPKRLGCNREATAHRSSARMTARAKEGKKRKRNITVQRPNAVAAVVNVVLCISSDDSVVLLILITALYFENSAFEAGFDGVTRE